MIRYVQTMLLVLLLCGAVPASAQGEARTIKIGLIPERNVFDQVARYEALTEYLAQELGCRFELTMLSRYGNIVDRISRNEIQAAFLGSFTGALAGAQLGMTPVARPVNEDGSSTYLGRIFVRRESSLRAVADMKGARLALVEKATTAGDVFPLAYLRRHGVEDLESYFSEVRYWGSHDAAINAVLDGEADVGAAKNTVMDWRAQVDPRVHAELETLASSDRVPSNALFLASSLDEDLKHQIQDLRTHTVVGGDTLRSVIDDFDDQSFLLMAMEIAYGHHEKWDGSGYPRGLAGEQIPLSARIVALCDAYDCITSDRVYKKASSHEEAIYRLVVDRGLHFDPRVVDAFLACHEDLDGIRRGFLREEKKAGPEEEGAGTGVIVPFPT
jgi:phosphate/phosphite/phosphonate ABC transporter binding protein